MKKNNSKFKDILSKIKKPLMILSVIGNVLFLLFILIGCVALKKNSSSRVQQVKAEDTPLIYDLYGSTWVLNDLITSSPNGSYLPNTGDTSYFVFDYLTVKFHFLDDMSGIDIDGNDFENDYVFDYLIFVSQNNVLNKATGCYAYSTQYHDDFLYIYRPVSVHGSYLGWRGVPYFPIGGGGSKKFKTINFIEHSRNTTYIDWLYNNATLIDYNNEEESIFTFNRNFNYNAPSMYPLDSVFVPHYFSSTSELGFEIIYDFPLFVSNGQEFNRIRLWFDNGYSVRYLDSDGVMHINENQTSACYAFMQFMNTDTNYSIVVNKRKSRMEYVNTDTSTQVFLDFGSTWLNNEYQTLHFYESLTTSQFNNLSQFNNDYISGSGFESPDSDVGLGGVFTLMGSAFTGIMPIMKIEILPNITIGLLLFLPLIVGIILTIIWLVKR